MDEAVSTTIDARNVEVIMKAKIYSRSIAFAGCIAAAIFLLRTSFAADAASVPTGVASPAWPAPLRGPFTGQWIWQSADGPANTWMAFRKTVALSQVPASVKALIAADTKYWLWINGKQAVFEGGLKRGPTRSDGYVDEVEIAPFLTAGNNTLSVLVWYYGRDTMAQQEQRQGRAVLPSGCRRNPHRQRRDVETQGSLRLRQADLARKGTGPVCRV